VKSPMPQREESVSKMSASSRKGRETHMLKTLSA